jgi:hypothetical protein
MRADQVSQPGNTTHEDELTPDRAQSLRAIFGEKLIEFGTMDGMTRWVTALGIAQIIAAVLLIGLSLANLPSIEVHGADGAVRLRVPVLVLITCVLSMTMAWTWLVVGALHARPVLRVPILLLFLGLHVALVVEGGNSLGWAFLVLWAIYMLWHGFAKRASFRRDLLVIGVSLGLFYLVMIGQYGLSGQGGDFATMLISLQVMVVSFLLMPLFMFTGIDLGESVRDVTRWLIGLGAVRAGEQALFLVAVGLCLVKVAALALTGAVDPGWVGASAYLLLAAWISVRMRPWLGLHQEPQVWLTLAGTIFVFGLMVALVVGFMVAGGGNDPAQAMLWTTGIAGTVAGVAALAVTLGRSATIGRRTAATYLALFAAWALVTLAGEAPVWRGLLHLPGSGKVGLGALDGAAALLLLPLLGWARRRGLATKSVTAWAISLTVGLSVIRGMAWLVQHSWQVPAMTAAGQLVILAAGLLWDVLTSGQRWTNDHSERVPRRSRVLLYFGYVALSVTALLYWKGSTQNGTFDEDMLALMGLTLLGIPLFLYGFARAGIMLIRQARNRTEA